MADTNTPNKDSEDTPSSQQAAPVAPSSQAGYPTLPPSTPASDTPQQQSQGYPTQPQSQGYPNQQQPQGYNNQQPPPQGYPNQQQPPSQGYPTQQQQQGYPNQQQPQGYPTQQQPQGNPNQQQPQGYPTQQQPQGYPNQQQPQGYQNQQTPQGYQNQQTPQGYPNQQPPPQGYPNQQPPPQGYPSQQQPQGYPNQQQPQQGHPNQQQPQGYPTQQQSQGYQQQQGYSNQQQGYPNQQSQGYQGQQPGYAPPQSGGYSQPSQSGGYSQPPVSGQSQGQPPRPPGYVPPPTTSSTKSRPPVPPGFTDESAVGFNQPLAQPQTSGQHMPQWMARPENTSNCPPGLEYLTMVDQILIQQQVDALETFTSFESQNKYTVVNSLGQQVYIAAEESELCMRQCLGSMRGFIIHMIDNMGQEVMKVTRKLKIGAGCCWFACCNPCSLEVVVEAPVGKVIGKVKQRCSFLRPLFDVLNENDEVVFKIQGPYCMWAGPCCIGDQNFYVHSPDMSRKVATISKEFSGLVKEMFTKADNFGISFPMDLDVNMKATLLGSVFLIDFMYYELFKTPTT